MTVRVIFKFFRDFYGQNYAYPTVHKDFICNFVEFVTVSIRLAEQNGIIREEPTYTFASLVSDVGGALGLILGLSILDILIPVSNLLRNVCNFIDFTVQNVRSNRFHNFQEAECFVSFVKLSWL